MLAGNRIALLDMDLDQRFSGFLAGRHDGVEHGEHVEALRADFAHDRIDEEGPVRPGDFEDVAAQVCGFTDLRRPHPDLDGIGFSIP